jgi:hypothetical protein
MRSVKLAKYLPEFGWEPHVVTVDADRYERVDATPLPFPCVVHRSNQWPTIAALGSRLVRAVVPARNAPARSTGGAVGTLPPDGAVWTLPSGFWRRLIVLLSMMPDLQVGWLVPGARLAIRVARAAQVDAIYTSGPPHTGHLVGWIASLATGLPLVCDFRDPWSTRGYPPGPGMASLFRWNDRWLEAKVVRRARLVIASTSSILAGLVAAHGPAFEAKSATIINGFDAEDFRADDLPEAAPFAGVISFVYAGSLYGGREPSAFFQALGELLADGTVQKGGVTVDFYGPVDIDASRVVRAIEAHGLQDTVHFRPSVKRQDYLKLVTGADVLILVQGDDTPWAVPAKTFEYLATGNEVLVLAGPYALADLVEGYEHVHRADPADVAGIKACVARIVGRIRSGARDRKANTQALSHMHKRKLTGEFARLLDGVVSSGGKPSATRS